MERIRDVRREGYRCLPDAYPLTMHAHPYYHCDLVSETSSFFHRGYHSFFHAYILCEPFFFVLVTSRSNWGGGAKSLSRDKRGVCVCLFF